MPRDPIATLEKLEKALDKRVGDILWDTLIQGRDHLKAHDPLKRRRRTGGSLYHVRPIKLQGNLKEGGIFFATRWGKAHIGPAGSTTTISPKGGHKFLALPTDFVKTFRGTPVGPKQYGGVEIFSGIIWGRAGWAGAGSAARQRRAAGEKLGKKSLVPLFILKGSVIIRRRIHPEEVLAFMKPIYFKKLREALLLDEL